MPIVTDPKLLTFKNWTFRLLVDEPPSDRLLILLHGWKRDENSIWGLAGSLSSKYAILGPRGPFAVPEGDFSWRDIWPGTWGMATFEDLRPAADGLPAFVDEWSASAGMDGKQ